jgi:phospholipase/carboxylesterase
MKKLILVALVFALSYWWLKDSTIRVPSNGVSFDYVIKYSGAGTSSDQLPMLIALHGNGDKADNFYETTLDLMTAPARIVLIQGPLSHGMGNAWPWRPDDFAQYGEGLSEAADLLAQKHPTVGKPILMGFSGGGMMAYYQAAKYGDSYSYVFPVSGQLTLAMLGDGALNPQAEVIAFHGKSDAVVPFGGGRKAVQILRGNGANVKFIEFDGGHHGIFTNMKGEITQAIEGEMETL